MDQAIIRNLTLATFNCKHVHDEGMKFDFMNDVANSYDVFFIQEHWLYKSHLHKLSKLGGGSGLCGSSAMDEDKPAKGRPHGGCAILWSPHIKAITKPIECKQKRLCAVLMIIDNMSILFINAYMPYDNRTEDENFHEYVTVLNEIEQIIIQNDAFYVILGGDLNTDFSRNSPHTRVLKAFVKEHNMEVCIELPNADVPYTYLCDHNGATSKIDHVIVSSNLKDAMIKCETIQNFFSDHEVVTTELNVPIAYRDFNAFNSNVFSRPAWYKASENEISSYKQCLHDALKNIEYDKLIFECNDAFCDIHKEQIQKLYDDILCACIETDKCIPRAKSASSKSKSVPGWDDQVSADHDVALWWHNKWKSEGRPTHGEISEMRRMTRAIYHKQVKDIRKKTGKIRKEKMANAVSGRRDRDLFCEIRKMKNKRQFNPVTVDNTNDVNKINNIFNNKYKNLYNSVPYNVSKMNRIKHEVDARICKSDNNKYDISVCDVQKAINHIKSGKSGGEEGIMSDHIIHAPHLLAVLLSLVFNAMIYHDVCPTSMLVGTMIPISKIKRQVVCSSDKFRAITLSSIFTKILDWIILIKEYDVLCSSELQFGFKPGVSTSQCSMVLQETINYYNLNKTNVFVLMLDASQAFDRVKYCKMFNLLLERNVPPLILRILIRMYTNQQLQVRWGNVMSDKFTASNGVKQGGVLSPILFAIYMDELLLRLKKSGVGCHVASRFVGSLSYADDIDLLCPTIKSLRQLAMICEKFAIEYDVLFNGTKSKLLVYKGCDCKLPIDMSVCINDEVVKLVISSDHLGHHISSQDNDSMVKSAINSFWRSFNLLVAEFGEMYSFVKCKLFKQYCCSFYGSPLWLLKGSGVESLCTAWRKALRSLWNVHPMTHKNTIAALSETIPIELALRNRFNKFYQKCLVSDNPIVQCMIKIAAFNPMSSVGKNIRSCDGKELNEKWINERKSLCDTVNVISELICVREKRMDIELYETNEIEFMIESLCID